MHKILYSRELGHRIEQINDPYENTFKWVFSLKKNGSGLYWIQYA